MTTNTVELDFQGDQLDRLQFAKRLVRYIGALADSDQLPAGRVLAVNAPWGSGKTWVAERLAVLLRKETPEGRPGIYINAFQFDFHHDPFSVLVSAVLESQQAKGKGTEKLKKAATAVLRTVLPAVAKGALKTAANKLVGEDGVKATLSALADESDKTISRMLDTVAETRQSTEAFRAALSAFGQAAPGPLVIVIDELDRCRPTFVLELLERIKHLFDVNRVVFVLFFHRDALNSVIRQTYGESIDPDAYLRKFVSVNVDMPATTTPRRSTEAETDFFRRFIESTFATPTNLQRDQEEFRRGLAVFAPVFGATLRDIQTVQLMATLVGARAFNQQALAAYALLLRLFDPDALAGVQQERGAAMAAEMNRLAPHSSQSNLIENLRLAFQLADPKSDSSGASPQDMQKSAQVLQWLRTAASAISLEYVRL